MLARDQEFGGGTAADVRAFAGKVAALFTRKGAPRDLLSDPDDWEQTAALALIEGVRKRGRTVHDQGYHFQAARREVGLVISKALATVSIWEKRAHLAREFQDRTPLVGCGGEAETGAVEIEFAGRADRRLMARSRDIARNGILEILARHVAGMGARDRLILEPLLGIRTLDPSDRAEVATLTRISRQGIDAAVKRLAVRVRQDRLAVRARRALLEA
jgi:hypothetical protein